MAAVKPEIKGFRGLYLQANSFDLPEGALEQAENVQILNQGVISKIKGSYTYFDPSSGTLNNLFNYKDYLYAVYGNKLCRYSDTGTSPNQVGSETALTGQAVTLTAPRVSRSAQAQDNLYFTTDNGVLKIEDYNSKIYKSGTPPASGLQARLLPQNGGIDADKQCGWRVVFGRRDINNSLLLGVPSDMFFLNNAAEAEVAWTRAGSGPWDITVDFSGHNLSDNMSVVVSNSKDSTGSPLSSTVTLNGNHTIKVKRDATWARTGAGPYTITVTTTTDHHLVTGMIATISGSSVPSMDGDYQITSTGSTTFTFSMVADPGASGTLNYSPTDRYFVFTVTVDPGDSSGTLDYSSSRTARLEFTVPAEISDINDKYFYQIYRTSFAVSTADAPDLNFALIDEIFLTSTDIANGIIYYDDDTQEIFRGVELYTNPNSREGEAQANNRPPLCQDMCLFKNHIFYANCISRHNLEFDIVSSATTYINAGDYLEFKVGSASAKRYVARSGVGNNATAALQAAFVTTTITVYYLAHGLSTGDKVYIANAIGTGSLPYGQYTITSTTTDSFQFTALATPTTLTGLDFFGLKNTSNYPIFQLVNPTTSVSAGLRDTAQGLVKAINMDRQAIYGKYISTPIDVPGKMLFGAYDFGDSFSFRANTDAVGQAFSPVLPSSFSTGNQVISSNDTLPNVFYSSKIGEGEAVPLVNTFPIGAKNGAILRCFALRDCVVMIKEDGIYRVDGDSVFNFTSTILDDTIFCVSANSADKINNEVVLLSNQGVVSASSNSVRIISRDIERPIKAVLTADNVSTETGCLAFESDRTYYITTLTANSASAAVTYAYNVLSEGWTTWTKLLKRGVVGPKDTIYFITTDNEIVKQRKNHTKLDYCNQWYAATVVSVASDKLSAVVTTAGTPDAGDVVVKSNVFNHITDVATVGGNYNLTFNRQCNLIASDSVILYNKYQSTIKFAPYHGGQVGINKQFTQLLLHLRDSSVSSLDFGFSSDYINLGETFTWTSMDVSTSSSGWGSEPWGYFPWGDENTILETYDTEPAPTIRIYIPLMYQRTKFLQPVLFHDIAGEAIFLQAMTFVVRPYGERISK